MVEIRREIDSDQNELFQIHQDAFQRDDEAQLVDKLRQNVHYNFNLSFVALVKKKIVGHLLFTPLQINYPTSGKSITSLALAPISILSDYQRQGIGSKLIEYALHELKAQSYSSVIVLGHEHYYPKFGFLPAKKYHISAPFSLENEDCFLALELQTQALPLHDGQATVQYLPEFGI
ncbi:unnamed protein product [Adineta ricciae]|uniref:N-acetyltransferase domain-containing protein n=1 Tax=Adineta ricciae TaxID=249248 RepID=A0A815WEN3_ADIRI|nr:unnamed protein product [Adineta ricciae]